VNLFSLESKIFYSVDDLISDATNKTSQISKSQVYQIHEQLNQYGFASLYADLFNFMVKKVDTIYVLDVLNVLTTTKLGNDLKIGGPSSSDRIQLSIDANLDFDGWAIQNFDHEIHDEFTISLGLSNFSALIDADAKVIKQRLLQLSLQNIVYFEKEHLLLPFESLSIENLELVTSYAHLNVSCKNCTSYKLNAWQEKLEDPLSQVEFSGFIQSILHYLSSPIFRNRLNEYLQSQKKNVGKPQIDSLSDSSIVSEDNLDTPLGLQIVVASLVSFLLGLCILWLFLKRRRAEKQSLQEITPSSSLFNQYCVSKFEKWLVVLLILSDIAFFITAHTSFAGDEIHLPSLFGFSLGNSIRSMWHAQVYPLALLILLFSGIWPYVKNVMLLACWTLPLNYMSFKQRKKVLHWLDFLGKWSLVDAYVLVLFMVAFRFYVESQHGLHSLPDRMLSIDISVFPEFGIHGFLIGAILQLALTHRIIAKNDQLEEREQQNSRDVEAFMAFGSDYRELIKSGNDSKDSYEFSKFAKCLFFTFLISSCGINVYGSMVDTFMFEFQGLAGYFLGANASQGYSLVSVTNILLKPEISVLFLWIVFLSFALVVPILEMLLIAFVWIIPLRAKIQNRILRSIGVLRAMGALDVFIISIIAALYGSKCDSINAFISSYAHGSFGEKDVCFDVVAKLVPDCYLLFVAAVIALIGNILFSKMLEKSISNFDSRSAIKDRIMQLKSTNYVVLCLEKLRILRKI
jgi:hypothetical protein